LLEDETALGARLDVHQDECEKGQPRYGFAKQRRKAALQAMCLFPGLGHHPFVTRQQAGGQRLAKLRPDEQPMDWAPIYRRVIVKVIRKACCSWAFVSP
jgi:hypothetical protein